MTTTHEVSLGKTQTIVKLGQRLLDTELGRKILSEELIVGTKKRLAPLCGSQDLTLLAYLHETDKFGYHNYIKHYQRHLAHLRTAKINLLEIGIGGDSSSTSGGASLRMWKQYFQKGNIYGIDINDKSPLNQERIKTFAAINQTRNFSNESQKKSAKSTSSSTTAVISTNTSIASFECLFPLLTDDGIYVIEDVQTSYWSNFGGSSSDLSTNKTMMGYFKNLTDSLNHQEFVPNRKPNYYDLHIVEVHFYHNMIFIQKGTNNEPPGQFGRPEN